MSGNYVADKSWPMRGFMRGASSVVLGFAIAGFAVSYAQEGVETIGAETSEEVAEDSLGLDRVVVTGSRISNPNLTSSSSVTTLGAEEIDARGVLRVEDLLSTLPQTLSGESSTSGVSGLRL